MSAAGQCDGGPAAGGGVVLLSRTTPTCAIVYNALVRSGFRVDGVILDSGESPSHLLRRRLVKLGPVKVMGQLAFMGGVVPLLRMSSRARIAEIKRTFGLDETPIPEDKITFLDSVASEQAIELLRELAPRAVVIHSTRILPRAVIRSTPAPFLNVHAGITPMYRGTHGGYWALAERRPDLCGVTVHYVDEGIDTGGALARGTVQPGPEDNFVTYPVLQLAVGLPLLAAALRAVLDSGVTATCPTPAGPSRLRSHPTIWEYAWNRLRLGVK
jgi:folate-dependent phosphoribosylglycinamide formyltransferase PurN